MLFFCYFYYCYDLEHFLQDEERQFNLLVRLQCSLEPSLVLIVSWGEHGSIFQGHNSNSAPIQALILLGESWVSLIPPPGDSPDLWYWLHPLWDLKDNGSVLWARGLIPHKR